MRCGWGWGAGGVEGGELARRRAPPQECIRALDQNSRHVPFRGSTLTSVLKDRCLPSPPPPSLSLNRARAATGAAPILPLLWPSLLPLHL